MAFQRCHSDGWERYLQAYEYKSLRKANFYTVYRATVFHLKAVVLEVVYLKPNWLLACGTPITTASWLLLLHTLKQQSSATNNNSQKLKIKHFQFDTWGITVYRFISLFFLCFSLDCFKEVLTIIKILLTGVLVWNSQILFHRACIHVITANITIGSSWGWIYFLVRVRFNKVQYSGIKVNGICYIPNTFLSWSTSSFLQEGILQEMFSVVWSPWPGNPHQVPPSLGVSLRALLQLFLNAGLVSCLLGCGTMWWRAGFIRQQPP